VALDEQNAIISRKRLYDAVPDGQFAFNQRYAAYRMGLGAGSPLKGGGCTTDRCFGAGLIKWRPELAACAQSLKIGVVDTGYDKSHAAFRHFAPVYEEFLPRGAKPVPQHGTAIMAILVGDPNGTTPGLIPSAEYYVANAFYADRGGQAMSDTVHILKALEWMLKHKVDVVNLSFSGPEDDLIHDAIKSLTSAGTIVVAAAGNEGPRAPPSYPAAYKEVIAVTAVDRNRAPYPLASRGSYIDVAAPGVGIWTAQPGGREGAQTGTSFAVPYVTAVIAANFPEGLGPTTDPTRTKRLALASLLKNVKGVPEQGVGAGLVQAAGACGVRPGAVAAVGSWTTVHSAVSADGAHR
jgi:hypothetical protein